MKIHTSFKMIPRISSHLSKSLAIMLVVFTFLVLPNMPVAAFDPVMDPIVQPETVGPISTLGDDQFAPVVSYASQVIDEYLVVWEEAVMDFDYDIYAIRVNSEGSPIGSEIQIATSGVMDTHPGVAYSPVMEEYLVVWENAYSPTDHDILATRIDANTGVPIGGVIYAAYTTNYDEKPVVTYNPDTHEYLVVYERRMGSDEFAQQDILARRVYEDGTLMGDEILIANSLLDEQAPAVACDGTNYLVVWQGDIAIPVETNLYGQRIAGGGWLIGGQIAITTWESDQLVPKITYNNNDGHYFVVWEDHHFTPWGIYGYRLDQTGFWVGSQVSIAVGGSKNRTDPDVVYLHDTRSYQVVWQFEWSASDHDIYTRRVAYDGSQPETETYISTQGTEEKHPLVAADIGNRMLVVWEDWRNQLFTGWDIYGSLEIGYVPILSGAVYEGDLGVITTPLANVTMQLGCSSGAGYFGDLIAQTVTNAWGNYELPAYILCEYYNILETDPVNYYSIGAQTTGGNYYSSNWIYYTHPLVGKELSGNNFWDKPIGPSDTTPPGNWVNFQPASWVNVHTVQVSEQVEDTLSGLDVSTAEYRYSTNGGASWIGWLPAEITGQDETTDPQVISAIIPFGGDSGPSNQNLVQFRVADMVGNLGESPIHHVYIDTVAPINPNYVNCPTHPVSDWSFNSNVSCEWSGATDASSGVAGYSVDWNTSPSSIPAPLLEITDPEADSGPLSDGTWYFHVRTIDSAGNAAAGAVHYGPILIDTDAPTAWMTTVGGSVNELSIFIEWDGGDTLSGVDYYEVQYNINGAGWSGWQASTANGAFYTGIRGDEVGFRVRAHDQADNIGDWSSAISLTFGVSVLVRAENENGSALSGAEIYLNGELEGETYADGTRTVYNVLLGDALSARYMVQQNISQKGGHDCCGGDWSYRTYITSINFDNTGNPQLQIINNTDVTQLVRVRRVNALVSFYIVVSVEWDADSTYLAELRTGLESASQYLYDVSDGQMMFGIIQVFDNAERWAQADIRIHASNKVWPNAGGSLGGIWHGTDQHIYMGRYFNGVWSNTGSWTQPDGFRTFIHEFGHYGLDLYDEYLNRNGGKDGQGCTVDRTTTPLDVQASFMDFQYTATEMCSSLTLHPHNTNTLQDKENGGPCWNTVFDHYKDAQSPERWFIVRPSERGSIMPGPNAIPITGWTYVQWDDNNTSACVPFETSWIYQPSNLPALFADTWVENGSTLYEGQTVTNTTNTAGIITILGAHNGDTIRVSKSCGWMCSISGSVTASCSAMGEGQEQTGAAPLAPIVLQKDPFSIEVSSQPLGDGSSLKVMLQGSTVFPQTPHLEIWQDGAAEPILITLAFDGVLYNGTANLDPTLKLGGTIKAQATDTQGYTVYRLVPFNIEIVNEEGLTWVQSSDGRMEVFLPAGSLSGNPAIGIQPNVQVNFEQDKLKVIGNPYQVTSSTGDIALELPGIVNIYYSGEDIYGGSLGLYQWDTTNQNWILISTNVDEENHFVSGQITELGTYAVLQLPLYQISLPLVSK